MTTNLNENPSLTQNSTVRILDIGCGSSKVQGAVGVDFNPSLDADVVHDLNKFPYPFQHQEFDEVHVKDTLFLLDNPPLFPVFQVSEIIRGFIRNLFFNFFCIKWFIYIF